MTITFERYTSDNGLKASICQEKHSVIYKLEIYRPLDDVLAADVYSANYQTIASARRAMKRFGETWTIDYKFGRETEK